RIAADGRRRTIKRNGLTAEWTGKNDKLAVHTRPSSPQARGLPSCQLNRRMYPISFTRPIHSDTPFASGDQKQREFQGRTRNAACLSGSMIRILAVILGCAGLVAVAEPQTTATQAGASGGGPRAITAPLAFERNDGQHVRAVRYRAHSPG